MSETDLQTVGYQALVDELGRRCKESPPLERGLVRFGLQYASLLELWNEIVDRKRDAFLVTAQHGDEGVQIYHTSAYAALGLLSVAEQRINARLMDAPATCEDDEATS